MPDEKSRLQNAGHSGYGTTPSASGYTKGGATPYPRGGPSLGTQKRPAAEAVCQGGATLPYQGEIPQGDLNNKTRAEPQAPIAPASGSVDRVPGYEGVALNATPALPPSNSDETSRGLPPERREFSNIATITEEEAREALLEHVDEHCCYGNRAVQEMTIRDLKSSSAFHYTLETFAESRSTCLAFEPFQGQPIDGPERGPAPEPWDIQAQPSALFKSSQTNIEVPHTSVVNPCHKCFGRGYEQCPKCGGRGSYRCVHCWGRGRTDTSTMCGVCRGSGMNQCGTCSGYGQVECPLCQTHGNLKCFVKLTVTWTNHVKDQVLETSELPKDLIRGVSGQLAFEEQLPRVWPIRSFPEQEVNRVSEALVTEHSQAFPTERTLMQRHHLRVVPVTQVFYTWNDVNTSYFVYGFEHKVHAPDYPQQCCCDCAIL